MSEFDEIWKEMLDLIPKMQKAVTNCLKRDIERFEHGEERMSREREGLRTALEFLRGKWTLDIIYTIHLLGSPFFNEIRNTLSNVNSRTLTDRLHELEMVGILNRVVKTGKPIRVYYELTEFGQGIYSLLIPLLSYFNEHQK